MRSMPRTVLLGASLLILVPGVRANTETGVIAAAVVAGVILLGGVIAVSIFCLNRKGGCKFDDEKPVKKRHHKKHKHKQSSNGIYPPPYHVDSRYLQKSNGFVQPTPIAPIPPRTVRPAMYTTYHGAPMEFTQTQPMTNGTHRPPPIVIPASFGTVTMRPDPRPVVKTRQHMNKDSSRDERRQYRSKSYDRSREQPKQEFVIQQSYDGIPVIRPVIYIDDDNHRDRHRSKSKSRSKSRERHQHANVTTIPLETKTLTQTAEVHASNKDEQPATENHVNSRPRTPVNRPKTPTPKHNRSPVRSPVRSRERSRASSVTEGLNALRKSTKGHDGHDSDTDSSKAPSFNWASTERAPEPRAGDVMFFPAGTNTTEQSKPLDREQVYGYTTVIKQSQRNSTKASVVIQDDKPNIIDEHDAANGGYEVPKPSGSVRGSAYETELSQTNKKYTDIGATMSDRLQYLVEDGDKTRFTKYNVGAIDFDEEDKKTDDEIEPVQLRVRRRPETPPADFPRDSFYSQRSARPKTPPNDIPLITPRESTEIPPLDLQSSVNSPKDYRRVLRPVTPPHDYPISNRPKTPPTDFGTPRPPTPPRDILDTNRSDVLGNNLNFSMRSQPVDPNTGAPGSFQARQRLIEAHLMKNVSPDKPGTEQTKRKTEVIQKAVPSSALEPPPMAPIHIPQGMVPPAPPPPPLPK